MALFKILVMWNANLMDDKLSVYNDVMASGDGDGCIQKLSKQLPTTFNTPSNYLGFYMMF